MVSLVGIVLEWRLAVHQGAQDGGQLGAFNETFLLVALLCAGAATRWRWKSRASN